MILQNSVVTKYKSAAEITNCEDVELMPGGNLAVSLVLSANTDFMQTLSSK